MLGGKTWNCLGFMIPGREFRLIYYLLKKEAAKNEKSISKQRSVISQEGELKWLLILGINLIKAEEMKEKKHAAEMNINDKNEQKNNDKLLMINRQRE